MQLFKRMFITAAAAALVLTSGPALAQESGAQPGASKRTSLKVDSADLRAALKMLFDSAGLNYSLEQSVRGTVTVSLYKIPFRTALESLLRSTESAAPLTYRIEDGVYHISPKIDLDISDGGEPELVTQPVRDTRRKVGKIALNWADVRDVVNAFGGSMIESRAGQLGGGGFGNGFGGFGGGFNAMSGGFGNGFGGGGFTGFAPNNSIMGPFQGNGFGNGFNNGFGNGLGHGGGSRGGGGFRRR